MVPKTQQSQNFPFLSILVIRNIQWTDKWTKQQPNEFWEENTSFSKKAPKCSQKPTF